MHKKAATVFSVVGPTSVGKSEAALLLAQNLLRKNDYSGVSLISADSRQIYKGLEIITGADVPKKWQTKREVDLSYSFFVSPDKNMQLHGVSIIQPNEEWSVSHFRQLALAVMAHSQMQDRAVILVGGTGLFHDQVFNTDPSLDIPPNPEIRSRAESLTIGELQKWLQNIGPQKLQALNQSDRSNPRRLIRIIEKTVAQENNNHSNMNPELASPSYTIVRVGLTARLTTIQERIAQRVALRMKQGAVDEVKKLLHNFPDATAQCTSTLGVDQVTKLIQGVWDEASCVDDWSLREYQYAKRQLTWWRKDKSVLWIDSEKAAWQQTLKDLT